MKIFSSTKSLQSEINSLIKSGHTLGFVPTMGALHEGHLSLLEKAKSENSTSLVSIFVNPTQFNDKKDLERYPRTLTEDLDLLEKAGCSMVFTPTEEEIYPIEYRFSYDPGELATILEGKFRPGHFQGVVQVVNRLFKITTPHKAYFGEKDYQQLAIIQKMVEDLKIPVRIIPCPILREKDGLAMSSRNRLLGTKERENAPLIYSTLLAAREKREKLSLHKLEEWVQDQINANPYLKTEYFCIVDAQTLRPLSEWPAPGTSIGCIAVHAGHIRLIDNLKF